MTKNAIAKLAKVTALQFTSDWMQIEALDNPWPKAACDRQMWMSALEDCIKTTLELGSAMLRLEG
jgi:hypothetical protein